MARPTKEQALTRDLAKVLSNLDSTTVKLIPKCIKRLETTLADPELKNETLFQVTKFLVQHAEKALQDRTDASKEDSTQNKDEVQTISFGDVFTTTMTEDSDNNKLN